MSHFITYIGKILIPAGLFLLLFVFYFVSLLLLSLIAQFKKKSFVFDFTSFSFQNMLQAIKFNSENGTLEVLDQLLLPHTMTYVKIATVEDAWNAIAKMKVKCDF